MSDYGRDRWVSFRTADGDHVRGTVTHRKGKRVRIVDTRGRRYTTSPSAPGRKVDYASVRPVRMGVFVLDTQLDKGWRSRRQGAGFWEEYCRHASDVEEWTFGYERVHSLADLRYILEKRTIKEHVLIFNGHGTKRAGWELSNGDCFRPQDVERMAVNDKNQSKVVLFSSCDIGKNDGLMEWYGKTLGAEAVIAYTSGVKDGICFLVEAALLQLIYEGKTPAEAVRQVRKSLDPWKRANGSRSIPLVCWSSK